jgi:biotin carboxyl carrier protein
VKFKIDIDGAERWVEAAADGTIVIDGERFQAKISASTAEKKTVQVGDKAYEVRVARRNEGEADGPSVYVLEVAGEQVPVTVTEMTRENAQPTAVAAAATAVQRPGGDAAGGAKEPGEYKDGIFAPVPGKIVDIRVKAGDTVKEGDLVLILEAMKMENELHAPKQATVAAVLVNKGDQAGKGQLLVAFE